MLINKLSDLNTLAVHALPHVCDDALAISRIHATLTHLCAYPCLYKLTIRQTHIEEALHVITLLTNADI